MRKALGDLLVMLMRLFVPIYFKAFGKLKREAIELDGVSAPFFVVSNHQATLDLFFVGCSLKGPMCFVATDMLFRVPIMNFLMKTIGSIPKSKFAIDSSAVREMMRRVRHGCSVAIFPEGQRCIAGYTEPLVPGIGKLAKMLDVPVVATHIKGGFMADPFWSLKKRMGPAFISAEVLLTREQLRSMEPEEIEEAIAASLEHSDYEWIKGRPELSYRGKGRAIGLHNVMYTCPECRASDCFLTEGDVAYCKSCGYSVRWGDRGEFILVKGSALHHENLESHDRWQRQLVRKAVIQAAESDGTEPIFGPCNATIRRSRKARPLAVLGYGKVSLYRDAIRFDTEVDCPREFALRSIQGFAISAVRSKHNRMFEFLDGEGNLYNIILHDPLESTYKWLLTVSGLKKAQSGRAAC